ncbi:unnamed protein product [Dovyalis caffra]|uniref:Uncharacterized protein n=1 Tax=Dovyalis caffra TaxID=77055 RepID=A0AAV1R9N6_9ROSI|nr:unnamed protein product [Dovyalis caffra]
MEEILGNLEESLEAVRIHPRRCLLGRAAKEPSMKIRPEIVSKAQSSLDSAQIQAWG